MIDDATRIRDKIETHRRVYAEFGLPIPPFRMTYRENIIFNRKLIECFDKNHDRNCLLARYMEVEIEIVVPLET